MARFYFFTNINTLKNQTVNQSFGPKEATEYRVSSTHKTNGTAITYAICDGIVFVQPVKNKPDLVNIILKPRFQNTMTFDVIQYIIYRRVLKSSLFNGDTIAASGSNDLTTYIWDTQALLNAANNTTETPPASILGVTCTSDGTPPNQCGDGEELDSVFYNTATDFEPFFVKGGWSIGTFDSTFSIDIVLGGIGFKPTLKIGRKIKNVLSVSNVSDGSNPIDVLTTKNNNQQILNYLDPCAFYGLFYEDGIGVKMNESDNTFQFMTGNDLYSQVLSKFHNKNTVYLDLRNEHNYSLNYYQNLNEGLKIGYGGEAVNTMVYGEDLPILRIEASSFTGEIGTLSLRFPKGDYDLPSAYLGQGTYTDGGTGLKDLTFTEDNYTETIQISIPKHAGGVMPHYLNLRYLKRISETATEPSNFILASEHFMDNLFDLKRLSIGSNFGIPATLQGTTQWHVTNEEVYVDGSSGGTYMAKVGLAQDSKGFYLFCFVNGEDPQSGGLDLDLVTGSSDAEDFLEEVLIPMFNTFAVQKELIPISDTVEVNALSDTLQTELTTSVALAANPDSVILIALDKQTDWQALQNTIGQLHGAFPQRLVIRNLQEMNDVNGEVYHEGTIDVMGYNTTTLAVETISTDIKYYKRYE